METYSVAQLASVLKLLTKLQKLLKLQKLITNFCSDLDLTSGSAKRFRFLYIRDYRNVNDTQPVRGAYGGAAPLVVSPLATFDKFWGLLIIKVS